MNHCEIGDCRDIMRRWIAEGVKVQMCVTSPPYWGLRDYGVPGQLGLESTPQEYVENMIEVFRLVRNLLADDGTLWLNLGDCYNAYNGGAGPSSSLSRGAQTTERPELESGYGLRHKGLKPKDLVGIPWRVAFALQADGWYLRQDIIWAKPNPMPESVRDRCTKSHEYLFLLAKNERYYYDAEAIAEPAAWAGYINSFGNKDAGARNVNALSGNMVPGVRYTQDDTRNKRSVWTVTTKPFSGAHFATFPPDLIEPCILAGSKPGDVVLDPFLGSGTTGEVAQALGRKWIGCELNPEYASLQDDRTRQLGMIL